MDSETGSTMASANKHNKKKSDLWSRKTSKQNAVYMSRRSYYVRFIFTHTGPLKCPLLSLKLLSFDESHLSFSTHPLTHSALFNKVMKSY